MPELSDRLAIPRARALYDYIARVMGRRMFLAQQECPHARFSEMEMEYLLQTTGRLPAIRGLDFMHDDYDGVAERALRWNGRGGIVTVCWHTGVEGFGYPDSKQEHPDFGRLLAYGTPENGLLRRRWDRAAGALSRLQEENVPVLWRPFHEFDGQWFWWGKEGGEAFRALWREMYRAFTEDYGLHNLIWVLGYADYVRPGWYPGSDVCDVLGSDTYHGVTTHAVAWPRLRALSPDKPLAFHECGTLPPPESFFREGAPWAWVMPWHTKWLTENNPPERIREIYRHERMITLDQVRRF